MISTDNYRASLIKMLNKDSSLFEFLDNELQNDEELISIVLKNNVNAFKKFRGSLRSTFNVAKMAVSMNGLLLSYVCGDLRDNDELGAIAVEQHPIALQYVSKRLQNNKDLVLKAVTCNHLSLQYAGTECVDDKTIVMAAVTGFGTSIKFASDRLKNDVDVIYRAIRSGEPVLPWIPFSLTNRLDILLEALVYSDETDEYIPPDFVHSIAVKFILEHRYDILPDDLDLVKQALIEQPRLFLNPPDVIKALSDEGDDHKYAIYAQYALNHNIHMDSQVILPTLE